MCGRDPTCSKPAQAPAHRPAWRRFLASRTRRGANAPQQCLEEPCPCLAAPPTQGHGSLGAEGTDRPGVTTGHHSSAQQQEKTFVAATHARERQHTADGRRTTTTGSDRIGSDRIGSENAGHGWIRVLALATTTRVQIVSSWEAAGA